MIYSGPPVLLPGILPTPGVPGAAAGTLGAAAGIPAAVAGTGVPIPEATAGTGDLIPEATAGIAGIREIPAGILTGDETNGKAV